MPPFTSNTRFDFDDLIPLEFYSSAFEPLAGSLVRALAAKAGLSYGSDNPARWRVLADIARHLNTSPKVFDELQKSIRIATEISTLFSIWKYGLSVGINLLDDCRARTRDLRDETFGNVRIGGGNGYRFNDLVQTDKMEYYYSYVTCDNSQDVLQFRFGQGRYI